MKTRILALVWGIGTLLPASPLLAHHAFSAVFDSTKPVTLKGTVTKLMWNNPHAWIYLDAKGPDGKIVHWAVETGGPNALVKRGWRKDMLPVGSEIIVEGFLAKDGTPTANAKDVTFPDGRKLFAGSSGTGAPSDR